MLFPFSEYWWLYLCFAALVLGLLAVDLSAHRKSRAISTRAALAWMGIWVGLALVFDLGLYWYASGRFSPGVAGRLSLEFLTGYVVEESLSVDNMFVFALIFRHFAMPPKDQHQALFYGVLGAMVFRGIFIGIGSALIHLEWVLILFGIFLLITGIRMAFSADKEVHPEKSFLMRWSGRMKPLVLVILLLETTDIMFAIDSVPAVFAVTREPFIVYTSNVFAILGLRSLYFLLAGALDRFHLLRYGLAAVLVFVGLKMIWLDRAFGGKFPIGWSLGLIAAALGVAIALSLAFPPKGRDIILPQMQPVAWWMEQRRMSLDALVGASGLDLKTVKAIVSANYTPSPSQRQRLAGALGISVSDVCWDHGVEVQHLRGNGPQVGRST